MQPCCGYCGKDFWPVGLERSLAAVAQKVGEVPVGPALGSGRGMGWWLGDAPPWTAWERS